MAAIFSLDMMQKFEVWLFKIKTLESYKKQENE